MIPIIRRRRRRIDPDRPKIRPELTPIDWLLEVIAICLLFTLIGFGIYWYQRAPEIVPTHFNARGEIDDYGSKDTLLFFPAICVFVYLLMTIINLFPHRFNFIRQITPENARKQYELATRFIRVLKLSVLCVFMLINAVIATSISGRTGGPGAWLLPVILGFVFIPMIVYFIISSRK